MPTRFEREGHRKVRWDMKRMMYVSADEWRKEHPKKLSSPCPEGVEEKEWRPASDPQGEAWKPRRARRLKEGEAKVAARREALGALIGSGVPEKQALIASGYSENSQVAKLPDVQRSVAATRERLQVAEGFRLEDSVEFYRTIRDSSADDASDRIRAQSRIDKVLGYDAPARVEVNNSTDLKVAIDVLKTIGLSPADAVLLAEEAEVVEDGEFEEVD